MRKAIETNPNGANQYLLDPRQKICWDKYINPKSETFANAYQSAMFAGYEEATAKQITSFTWFVERRRRLEMLGKAEKVLDKTLDIEREGADMKLAQDTAKFIASRLGKNEGYSERSEHAVLIQEIDSKEIENANKALEDA